MASKDAMYDAKVAAAAKAAANANTIKEVGPSGGLRAGVIAGVNPPPVAETVIEPVIETVIEPETPQWVKVGTIQTASGPVDVDAKGLAADGSKPVAVDGIRKYTATDGQVFTDQAAYATYQASLNDVADKKLSAQQAAAALTAKNLAERVSAYDLLYAEFDKLGLGSLVSDVKQTIINSQSASERLIALRNSKAYQTRFAANAKRTANGFKAIDEATYLGLEDKYQQIAQNYGLPSKYYSRGQLGVQQYFEDAIAKNIDPITFEERIVQGQKVLNANRSVLDAAKKFYPDLNDSDFLDYVLNPENALSDIKRKVSAAEIGGAQMAAGLQATRMGAEDLIKAGVTGQQYQSRASAIAEGALRGGQLASIYGQDPYTQQSAEQVALNLPGSTEAMKEAKKIIGLENASFRARPGLTGGALSRDRAGAI